MPRLLGLAIVSVWFATIVGGLVMMPVPVAAAAVIEEAGPAVDELQEQVVEEAPEPLIGGSDEARSEDVSGPVGRLNSYYLAAAVVAAVVVFALIRRSRRSVDLS